MPKGSKGIITFGLSKVKNMNKEENKALKAQKKKERREKRKGVIAEFKTFISRGNVVDLAVGVIIGSAFSAIVTAVTNIFLSICTWGLPGGLKGLITILPAANSTQAGIEGIGQSFNSDSLNDMVHAYGEVIGVTVDDSNFIAVQSQLLSKYTLYGGTYVYNSAAIIDWGTLLNAIISFFLIAVVLFLIVKTINFVHQKNEKFKADQLELYYQRHPEERPAPVEPGVPAPTEAELLTQIRDELKKLNAPKDEKKK